MSDSSWLSWDQWLARLDDGTRSQAEALRDAFVRRGAEYPEERARSEISDGDAELATYMLLAGIWRRMENAVGVALESQPAADLSARGCDLALVDAVARIAVHSVAFEICHLLDHPEGTTWREDSEVRSDVEPDSARWSLREVLADGSLTGRDLPGLHEALAGSAPPGEDGERWYRLFEG